MNDVIRVGIADMNTCMAGDTITTIGLGSCVGIVLYERTKNIAGLVHIMLPDSTKIRQNQNKLKFADTGIQALVEELEKAGRILVIRPTEDLHIARMEKDPERVQAQYRLGRRDTLQKLPELRAFLTGD